MEGLARRLFAAFVAAAAAGLAAVCGARGGEYQPLSVNGCDAAFTNAQANCSWELRGVLFKWEALPSGTVSVSRVSGGVTWLLAAEASPSTNMWWVADGPVTFRTGDAVLIGAGGGVGAAQILYGRGEQ